MGVIELLIPLLSSNVMGSLFGWIGGWLNKKEDLKKYKLDLEDRKLDRAHDIAVRNIDITVMDKELAGKERIAVIQKEEAETEAALTALQESYKHDTSLKGGKWTEALRAAIRPMVTLYMVAIASAQTGTIVWIAFSIYKVEFSSTEMYDLVRYSISWVLFQSGLCIGWWFANRSSNVPDITTPTKQML